jgi:type IV pilus assembly protein PilC
MPTFKYTAQTKDGKLINSTIDAVNLNVAIDTLTASKLKILEIKPLKFNPSAWFAGFAKASQDNIVMMTRRLGIMLRSGLPIARALQVLYEQENDKKLKPTLMTVLHDIRVGATLSWAMAKHQGVFSSLYISMIKIGETTGDMATMLERLADFLERDLKVKKQAQSALTYPAFILGFCILVVGVIFVYILPQMLEVFVGIGGGNLPLLTKIMIFIVNTVRNPYVQLSTVLGTIYYTIYFRDYIKTPEGKFKFDRFLLKIPMVGLVNKKLIIGNFCRAMGILLATGIPLLKGLEVLMEFMENEYFKQLVCIPLYEGVKEGKGISATISELGFFPSMAANMINVGESTGELATMLTRISAFYDQELVYTLEAFLNLLEPVMISFMGLIVCFVLLAVFLPLYQIIMNMG